MAPASDLGSTSALASDPAQTPAPAISSAVAAAMTQVIDMEGDPATESTGKRLREDHTSEATRQGDTIMHDPETADEASILA